jgi:hypothetical protein
MAHVSFAVALALNRCHTGFCFARAAFVHHNQNLADNHRMFRFNLRPVLADGVGSYMNAEFLSVLIMSMQSQRDGQRDSLCAAAFFTAKVQ